MISYLVRAAGSTLTKNKLSILIYHQVLAEADPMRPTEPTAARFRWQMELIRRNYSILPLSQASKLLKEGRLPANSACVTFDDGYLNNLTVAQPILAELGIPATVFVATAFSHGENMWNDRLIDLVGNPALSRIDLSPLNMSEQDVTSVEQSRALVRQIIPQIKYLPVSARKQLIADLYTVNKQHEAAPKMMQPQEVKRLAETGTEIGAHTVDHPILKELTVEQQYQQISQSKQQLESWLEQEVVGFAYPNGRPMQDYESATVEQVEKAGFHYAVTTQHGVSTPQTSPYELNRFTPWDRKPAKFHARLLKNALL